MLFGGLFLVHRRPVLAGAILGALVIKPQLGMLVPLCLIASGNWRALLAMATSANLLIAASALLFGVDAWIGFLVHTRPMIAAILEAPWRALPTQQNFASPLMTARSIGASMEVAYGIQTAVTLLCGAVAWWTWRTPDFERIPRVALTGLLALAAAPWVHTYDMIPLAVAIVVLAPRMHWPSALLGFAWFWPGAVVLLPTPLPLSVARNSTRLSLLGVVWREGRHNGSAAWNIPATLRHREKGAPLVHSSSADDDSYRHAGRRPGSHAFVAHGKEETWMPGPSPSLTAVASAAAP